MNNLDYIALDRSTLEEMPNGFLSFEANLTRTGVFTYVTVDSEGKVKVQRQLRLPEEVFAADALASLKGLPYTNGHPTEKLLTLHNASNYMIGMAADAPRRVQAQVGDGLHKDNEDFIRQRLVFYGLDAISDIKSGMKKEISLGYTYSLDETPGTYKGINYDSIQRNIRYNHGSLVQRARGGPNCKIVLDSGLEIAVDGEFIPEEDETMKFKFQGKEYEVANDVHALLTELSDSATSKTTQVEKLTARVDELSTKINSQNNDELAVEFKKAVKERVSLESQGRKILGEEKNFDSMGDREIKIAVIQSIHEGLNLDSKSDEYIDARFDIVVEEYKPEDPTKELGVRGVVGRNTDADDVFTRVEKARKKAWERDRQAYKRSK
jgi:hypothetical protein